MLPPENLAVGFATVVEEAKGPERLQRSFLVQLDAIVRPVMWVFNDPTPNLGDRLPSLDVAVGDNGSAKMIFYYVDNFHVDRQGTIPRGQAWRGQDFSGKWVMV